MADNGNCVSWTTPQNHQLPETMDFRCWVAGRWQRSHERRIKAGKGLMNSRKTGTGIILEDFNLVQLWTRRVSAEGTHTDWWMEETTIKHANIYDRYLADANKLSSSRPVIVVTHDGGGSGWRNPNSDHCCPLPSSNCKQRDNTSFLTADLNSSLTVWMRSSLYVNI